MAPSEEPLGFYNYNGTRIAQGKDATKQMLKDNPELADEIEAQIKAKLKGGDALPEEPEEADASEENDEILD